MILNWALRKVQAKVLAPAFFSILVLQAGCSCQQQCAFDESGIPADPVTTVPPAAIAPQSLPLPAEFTPPEHMHSFTLRYTARSGGHALKILDQQPFGNQWWILAEVQPPPPDVMTTMALQDLEETISTPVPEEFVRVFLIARDAGFGDQQHTLIPNTQAFYEALRTPTLH